MDASTVLTLATIPAILAIVQLGKSMGWIVGKWAALAAVVLGIIFNLADYGFRTDPALLTPAGWYGSVIAGLILGLSAAGLYDASAVVGSSVAKAITENTTVVPNVNQSQDPLL